MVFIPSAECLRMFDCLSLVCYKMHLIAVVKYLHEETLEAIKSVDLSPCWRARR